MRGLITTATGSRMTIRNRGRIAGWVVLGAILVPLGILYAATPDRLEKTLDTTSKPRIGVVNFSGHIVVKGWDKKQMHAVITNFSPDVRVDMNQLPPNGPADGIHFMSRSTNPSEASENKAVDFMLDVPLGSSVEIRNPEGSVQIDRLNGDASVESIGGVISVSNVQGHLAVSSIEGNIEILRPAGRVEATSICGNLHIVSPTGSLIKGRTTSGKITFEGDFISGAEYSLTNYSGETDIFIPSSASFELSKNTVRGRFFSDIPLPSPARTASRFPAAETFVGTNPSSTATVQLSSFSGNIYIHRLH